MTKEKVSTAVYLAAFYVAVLAGGASLLMTALYLLRNHMVHAPSWLGLTAVAGWSVCGVLALVVAIGYRRAISRGD